MKEYGESQLKQVLVDWIIADRRRKAIEAVQQLIAVGASKEKIERKIKRMCQGAK